MNQKLRTAFDLEMASAAAAESRGEKDRAFVHLERAHILGQRHTWPHVRSHLAMLRIGWRRRDRREIVGQFPRILAALVFSRIWVPLGNTGGANVSPIKPMPIPSDLAEILRMD
jgi:hypothetical protein